MVIMTTALISGCASRMYAPDCGVVNVNSSVIRHTPEFEHLRIYKQELIWANPDSRTFATLMQHETYFALSTYDVDARFVKSEGVPAFKSNYTIDEDYALSPNGRKLVYFTEGTTNIYWFDIAAGQEYLLWEGIAENSRCVYLRWLSDTKVLAVVNTVLPYKSFAPNNLTIIDVPGGARRGIDHPFHAGSAVVSPSLFAAVCYTREGTRTSCVLSIFDHHSETLRTNLLSTSCIDLPRFSPDGSALAFVEGNEIKVWRSTDGTTRTVRIFPDGYTFRQLIFGTGIIGYVGGAERKLRYPLVILDAHSGNVIRSIEGEFCGPMLMVSDTNMFACQIGYL